MLREPPLLRGPRVVVRLGEPSDVDALIPFFRDNDAFWSRTQNAVRPELMREDSLLATLLVRRADYDADRACQTYAFDRETGEPIALANLSQFVRGYFQACYLGYMIAERHQGRGLMHEAVTLLLAFAFGPLELHRVMANHTPDNPRSAALLQRLGFRREGYAPRYLRIHDAWCDHVLTALHAEDFQSTKTPPPQP
ncbi:MAG TPA: GNAT family N-acetyltransferase [Polyangiales bacterium]|nr:GNAT family N-acetyltransferase [Polyangiales bacterium]